MRVLPFHFLDGVSVFSLRRACLSCHLSAPTPPSRSLQSAFLVFGDCEAWPSYVKQMNPQSCRNLPLVIVSGDLTLLTSVTKVKD